MTIVAFAGPSLTAADRAARRNVDWRGPAEAGDMLRLQVPEGGVVCLIDGYFDHRPAVRHKELLLLLSRGITVFGASSMGALRAAEMDTLGMMGVGAIYRAYATGRLRGDDEVALVHAPEHLGWKGLSLPLVDCRANLHQALRTGVVDCDEARMVLRAAKAAHYADRDWPALLAESGLPAGRQSALLEWVEARGFSQKRVDAIACLEAAATPCLKTRPAPSMVRTSLLAALARECGLAPEQLS